MLTVPLGEKPASLSLASRDMEIGAYTCGFTKRKNYKEYYQ